MELVDDTAGVTDVPGFRAAGVPCDVRENGSGQLDLALIVSDSPCNAAAVFTRHDLPAAPVQLGRDILEHGEAVWGAVINSGNANACTGPQGLTDAKRMCEVAGESLSLHERALIPGSTGRIGRHLPMAKLEAGIRKAANALGSNDEHGRAAAQAILTSDTRPKTATVRIPCKGGVVTLAGMAKGAGMIQPDMATMLAYVCTDASIDNEALAKVLRQANEQSFNRITVDGDMSTNDTVLVLANGQSGVDLSQNQSELELFGEALQLLCQNLARKIVADGERVSKLVELQVLGARNPGDAEQVARSVANSLLVKTSWYGNDPNWGRLADAAGYAGAGIREDKLDILYNETPVLVGGCPRNEHSERWREIVSADNFRITLNLNLGEHDYQLLTTDLTEGYVDFNKSE